MIGRSAIMPGEGVCLRGKNPSPGVHFAMLMSATLSHKGRGCIEFAAGIS